jgi:hypothetical protein
MAQKMCSENKMAPHKSDYWHISNEVTIIINCAFPYVSNFIYKFGKHK